MRVAAMVVVATAATAATDTRRRSITAAAVVGARVVLLAAIPTESNKIGQSLATNAVFVLHGLLDIPTRLPCRGSV
jgi:hypothetical protein